MSEYDYRMGRPPILRKDIPASKYNRTMCCVYGLIDPTGAERDLVCGIPTKKSFNKHDECFEWAPFCPHHQRIVDACQPELDGDGEEIP